MRYVVIGPEVSEVIPVTDDGMGPTEHWHDVYLVDAPNRRAARWAAWQCARRLNDHWYQEARSDGVHPMTGVKVEPAEYEITSGWNGRYVNVMVDL